MARAALGVIMLIGLLTSFAQLGFNYFIGILVCAALTLASVVLFAAALGEFDK
jgi:hypothetical protein